MGQKKAASSLSMAFSANTCMHRPSSYDHGGEDIPHHDGNNTNNNNNNNKTSPASLARLLLLLLVSLVAVSRFAAAGPTGEGDSPTGGETIHGGNNPIDIVTSFGWNGMPTANLGATTATSPTAGGQRAVTTTAAVTAPPVTTTQFYNAPVATEPHGMVGGGAGAGGGANPTPSTTKTTTTTTTTTTTEAAPNPKDATQPENTQPHSPQDTDAPEPSPPPPPPTSRSSSSSTPTEAPKVEIDQPTTSRERQKTYTRRVWAPRSTSFIGCRFEGGIVAVGSTNPDFSFTNPLSTATSASGTNIARAPRSTDTAGGGGGIPVTKAGLETGGSAQLPPVETKLTAAAGGVGLPAGGGLPASADPLPAATAPVKPSAGGGGGLRRAFLEAAVTAGDDVLLTGNNAAAAAASTPDAAAADPAAADPAPDSDTTAATGTVTVLVYEFINTTFINSPLVISGTTGLSAPVVATSPDGGAVTSPPRVTTSFGASRAFSAMGGSSSSSSGTAATAYQFIVIIKGCTFITTIPVDFTAGTSEIPLQLLIRELPAKSVVEIRDNLFEGTPSTNLLPPYGSTTGESAAAVMNALVGIAAMGTTTVTAASASNTIPNPTSTSTTPTTAQLPAAVLAAGHLLSACSGIYIHHNTFRIIDDWTLLKEVTISAPNGGTDNTPAAAVYLIPAVIPPVATTTTTPAPTSTTTTTAPTQTTDPVVPDTLVSLSGASYFVFSGNIVENVLNLREAAAILCGGGGDQSILGGTGNTAELRLSDLASVFVGLNTVANASLWRGGKVKIMSTLASFSLVGNTLTSTDRSAVLFSVETSLYSTGTFVVLQNQITEVESSLVMSGDTNAVDALKRGFSLLVHGHSGGSPSSALTFDKYGVANISSNVITTRFAQRTGIMVAPTIVAGNVIVSRNTMRALATTDSGRTGSVFGVAAETLLTIRRLVFTYNTIPAFYSEGMYFVGGASVTMESYAVAYIAFNTAKTELTLPPGASGEASGEGMALFYVDKNADFSGPYTYLYFRGNDFQIKRDGRLVRERGSGLIYLGEDIRGWHPTVNAATGELVPAPPGPLTIYFGPENSYDDSGVIDYPGPTRRPAFVNAGFPEGLPVAPAKHMINVSACAGQVIQGATILVVGMLPTVSGYNSETLNITFLSHVCESKPVPTITSSLVRMRSVFLIPLDKYAAAQRLYSRQQCGTATISNALTPSATLITPTANETRSDSKEPSLSHRHTVSDVEPSQSLTKYNFPASRTLTFDWCTALNQGANGSACANIIMEPSSSASDASSTSSSWSSSCSEHTLALPTSTATSSSTVEGPVELLTIEIPHRTWGRTDAVTLTLRLPQAALRGGLRDNGRGGITGNVTIAGTSPTCAVKEMRVNATLGSITLRLQPLASSTASDAPAPQDVVLLPPRLFRGCDPPPLVVSTVASSAAVGRRAISGPESSAQLAVVVVWGRPVLPISAQAARAVQTTAAVTGMASLASGSVTMVVSQSMLAGLSRLVDCDALDPAEELPPLSNILRLGVGDTIGKYHRGALVGNIIIVVSVTVGVVGIVGIILWARKLLEMPAENNNFAYCASLIGCPSLVVVGVAVVSESTAAAATVLLQVATGPGDYVLAVLCLGLLVGYVVYVLRTVTWAFRGALVWTEEKEKHQRQLQQQKNKHCDEALSPPTAAAASPSRAWRFFTWCFTPRADWMAASDPIATAAIAARGPRTGCCSCLSSSPNDASKKMDEEGGSGCSAADALLPAGDGGNSDGCASRMNKNTIMGRKQKAPRRYLSDKKNETKTAGGADDDLFMNTDDDDEKEGDTDDLLALRLSASEEDYENIDKDESSSSRASFGSRASISSTSSAALLSREHRKSDDELWMDQQIHFVADYRFGVFNLVELVASIIVGVLEGIITANISVCRIRDAFTLAVFFGLFAFPAIAYIALVRVNQLLINIINGLAFGAALCIVLGNYFEDDESFPAAVNVCTFVGMVAGIIKFGVDMLTTILDTRDTFSHLLQHLKRLRKRITAAVTGKTSGSSSNSNSSSRRASGVAVTGATLTDLMPALPHHQNRTNTHSNDNDPEYLDSTQRGGNDNDSDAAVAMVEMRSFRPQKKQNGDANIFSDNIVDNSPETALLRRMVRVVLRHRGPTHIPRLARLYAQTIATGRDPHGLLERLVRLYGPEPSPSSQGNPMNGDQSANEEDAADIEAAIASIKQAVLGSQAGGGFAGVGLLGRGRSGTTTRQVPRHRLRPGAVAAEMLFPHMEYADYRWGDAAQLRTRDGTLDVGVCLCPDHLYVGDGHGIVRCLAVTGIAKLIALPEDNTNHHHRSGGGGEKKTHDNAKKKSDVADAHDEPPGTPTSATTIANLKASLDLVLPGTPPPPPPPPQQQPVSLLLEPLSEADRPALVLAFGSKESAGDFIAALTDAAQRHGHTIPPVELRPAKSTLSHLPESIKTDEESKESRVVPLPLWEGCDSSLAEERELLLKAARTAAQRAAVDVLLLDFLETGIRPSWPTAKMGKEDVPYHNVSDHSVSDHLSEPALLTPPPLRRTLQVNNNNTSEEEQDVSGQEGEDLQWEDSL